MNVRKKTPATEQPQAVDNMDQLLATINALSKDSPEFQQIRNRVFSKSIAKPANPKLVEVLREAQKLYSWDQLHLAYLHLKREQPKPTKTKRVKTNGKEKEDVDSE
jgi:hypothetical protein